HPREPCVLDAEEPAPFASVLEDERLALEVERVGGHAAIEELAEQEPRIGAQLIEISVRQRMHRSSRTYRERLILWGALDFCRFCRLVFEGAAVNTHVEDQASSTPIDSILMLTFLGALIGKDDALPGFKGSLAIGIRSGDVNTWWRAVFAERAFSELL